MSQFGVNWYQKGHVIGDFSNCCAQRILAYNWRPGIGDICLGQRMSFKIMGLCAALAVGASLGGVQAGEVHGGGGLATLAPADAVEEASAFMAVASWYGKKYRGRPTASGEIFDPAGLTAAHPSLPFGTLLEVRNLADGRSVVVRINDRGPFGGTRDIDLSEAAARRIGLIGPGVAPVTLRPVAAAPWQ